ncbi:MAG: ABC transporter substrate-binding protein, partial [Microbacteriaceae bacterium]|nr:ABC transporter substrate-binding protein [Microbacteriaceae bacterium]
MQKSRFIKGLVALAAASSLLLAGCASNSNSGGDSKAHEIPASEVDSGAIITTNGSNPQNPLIPSNTSEQGGGRIVHLLFSSLTYHDENAKEQYDIAESIETKDNINYTVKIKKDAAFSDGTPTKAKDFVDTWNFAANLDNKQAKRNFFEDIKGFEKDKPVAKLEGLKVVDDHTFTIELK